MKSFIIKKGHNIKIGDKTVLKIYESDTPKVISFHPCRIKSFKTKLLVKINDKVKVGSPLFYDKNNKEVLYVSSVSGVVKNILYGERRIVESLCISNDGSYESEKISTKICKETLLKSGLWSLLRQKPFSKVPGSDSLPRSFFISSIPTEPFAIDYNYLFDNIDNCIQEGINVLKDIFKCDINMSISENSFFSNLDNVNFYRFNKLHPSGNIGIQIHHIDPIKNSADARWYLSLQDLNRIGSYFKNKIYQNFKYISINGDDVNNPGYYKTIIGTSINDMDIAPNDNTRIISGDVLSGKEISKELSIDFYDEILSIIRTSNKREFLGWILPGLKKYSLTNTFLSKLLSNKKSILNTNLNGSVRTIIPMGNWESVLPMNIYPEYLIKSILSKDIDLMEKLGIYEVSPEDFSLCSFICQSKVEVSKIIQDGLDLIEAEI